MSLSSLEFMVQIHSDLDAILREYSVVGENAFLALLNGDKKMQID